LDIILWDWDEIELDISFYSGFLSEKKPPIILPGETNKVNPVYISRHRGNPTYPTIINGKP
jgi:hypothetical protein